MTSTTSVATRNGTADTSLMEDVITKGDLEKLSPEQRARYYLEICSSLGLNPLTRPLDYIRLSGKLVLYANKGATDQLRSIRNITVRIVSREQLDDVYVVTAEASTPDGRTDSDIGAVPIAGLKGDALANALMRATTKAKRRVTLSLAGLGMLDESEVSSVPSAQVVRVDHASGEIIDAPETATTALPEQRSFPKLFAIASKLSLTNADVHALALLRFDVHSLRDLTPQQLAVFIDSLASVEQGQATESLGDLHAEIYEASESVNQETGVIHDTPDTKQSQRVSDLIAFRKRYDMASTKEEFSDLFAEAGDRTEYWLTMIESTTALKHLERLAEVAAQWSAWTKQVADAYANRHAALTERDTVGT